MSEQANPSPELQMAGAGRLCKRAWWAFLIGGLASVAFGIMAFANPAVALLALAMFFAAFILIDGAANIWGALQNRDQEGWVAGRANHYHFDLNRDWVWQTQKESAQRLELYHQWMP